MQTQTYNKLHNAIMEAGSKDRPPMLAPGNYVQWKSIIKRYIDTKPNHELIHYCLENPPYKLDWKDIEVPVSEGSPITTTARIHETYKNVSQEIRDQLNAEAEVVQIILTGIDNDIYSTVDACSNAFLASTTTIMAKHEVNKIRAKKIARVANPLVAQQQPEYHPQNHPTHYTQNSSTRSQQAATRNRGKAIVNSPQPIYDQEPSMVAEDDETSKDKEIDKLMALISLSFKKIYKPANNNLRTSSNTSRANQDNSLSINRCAGYKNQRIGNVAGARENVGTGSALYVYGTTSTDSQNVIIDSLDMNYDREEIDQNDGDNDLAKERELLASLIEKLKCEIGESKNRNKFLETSNNVLIEKLKGEIEDFKTKNKSLQSSNSFFKEANNKLSETNNLLYADYKKSEAELVRRNSKEYASQMELECAKVRGDLLSYKMDYHKSSPDSEEVIRLEKEIRSKLSDLIRQFDYDKLNNLYDLFVPQHEKSSEQRYFLERLRLSHTNVNNGKSKESFHKQTTLLEKRMDESIQLDKQCQSSLENFKVKSYVNTIITGVKLCKQKIANKPYIGYIDPFIQCTIESNFCPVISRINAGLAQFQRCLNEEMVADLRYF
nr:hypothetical protein [Tanacetum cinerariifolium]